MHDSCSVPVLSGSWRYRWILPALLLVLPVACEGSGSADNGDSSGGSTSGESSDGSSDGVTATATASGATGDCEETVTVVGAADQTSLGFSANELLEDKLGPHMVTLTFYDEPATVLAEWVEGAIYDLTVTLSYEGGEIRDVKVQSNGAEPGTCEDHVAVDVVLSFATRDGSFNEQHAAELTARAVESAGVHQQLFPPDLAGSFDLPGMYDDGVTKVAMMEVQATFENASTSGEVWAQLEHTEFGAVGYGTVAAWEPLDGGTDGTDGTGGTEGTSGTGG